MSALTVDLPDELHERAREMAAARNLSLDALVAIALAQSLSRMVPDAYLEERAARATGGGVKDFLAAVPGVLAIELDRLPEGYKPKS